MFLLFSADLNNSKNDQLHSISLVGVYVVMILRYFQLLRYSQIRAALLVAAHTDSHLFSHD